MNTQPHPHAHDQPGLAEEFRSLAAVALDRLQPWVDHLHTAATAERSGAAGDPADGEAPGDGDAPATPAACHSCPVCAVLAVLRGERSELGERLAEQAVAMLATLRAALDEGGAVHPTGAGPEPEPSTGQAPTPRRVQRIPVVRSGGPAIQDPVPGSPTC